MSKIKKMELDEWQKQVLGYDGDLLLCTGRRVGKTYILARKAIDKMANSPRGKCPIVIMSLTEDQALLILSMALNYAKETYPSLLGDKKDKPTLKSLVMNGSKMVVRPAGSTGDGVRGFEGGVLIVDEASRMPYMFWIAATPIILTTGGQIWLASTPFGKGTEERPNYFWKRFEEGEVKKDPDARYKVFYITSEEVIKNRPISDTWTEEQRNGALRGLKEDKKTMTEKEYAQEYLGLFLEDILRLFPDELLERACVLKRPSIEAKREGKYYGGVDVARLGKNKSAFAIGKKISKDYAEQVEQETATGLLTTETLNKIISLQNGWKCRKWGIDGAGVGGGVLDQCFQIPELRYKVVDLNNAKRATDADGAEKKGLMKEHMYVNLLRMLEHNQLKLLDDDTIKSSLAAALYEYDERGNMRVYGSENDIRESIVRMAHLLSQDKSLNLFVTSSSLPNHHGL